MIRYLACGVMLAALSAPAATLEYLSLEEMASKATAIVRGRVAGKDAVELGPVIYTRYSIEILEQWKGPNERTVTVLSPGGTLNGLRQVFPGSPVLEEGAEYVLFLWTGSSGITQIVGLSQGLFVVERSADGETSFQQAGPREPLLDSKSGRLITERPLRFKLTELRSRIRAVAARDGGGNR